MAQPTKENTVQSSFRIIVIDDDEGLNLLIQKALKRNGYKVDSAENGNEALSRIKCDDNEILLVDYKLPDMTGKQLIQKVVEKFDKTPNFISMTGFGDEKIAVDMMKLGALDYIIKETNFIDLLPDKLNQICLSVDKTIKLNKVEDKLHKQSQLLNETGQMAKVGGWSLDLKTMQPYFTDETYRIYGLSEKIPPSVEEGIKFYAPEARPMVEKALKEAIENHKSYDIEAPFISAKGEKLWVRTIGKVNLLNGKAVELIGTLQDITKRKLAEDELRNANLKLTQDEKNLLSLNSQLSLAQSIAELGYWTYDIESQKPKWTDEVFKMYDIPRENGEPAYNEHKKYIHPYDWDLFDSSVQKLVNNDVPYDLQLRLVNNNNKIVWVRSKGFSRKNSKGETYELYGIIQNITDYKNSEKLLIEQKLLFETMFNSIDDAVVLTDTSRKIVLANNGVEKTFGYKPEELIGKYTEVFYADENKFIETGEKFYGKNAKEGKNLYTTYYRDKQNKVFPGETFGTKLKNTDGEWIGNLGIMRNVSQQLKYIEDIKKAKEAAEKNEQDFRLLFENMNQGFALHKMIYNKNDKPIGFEFVKVSPAYEKITQRDITQHLGQDVYKIFPNLNTKWISFFNNIVKTDKNEQFEFYDKKLDKYYLINAFRTKAEFFAILITDITSLKKYEKELIASKDKAEESDRLKSAFLANMSHEIRTPMNGILGFTNLLTEPNLTGKQKEKYIDIIQKSGDRMLNTVNDIINISKIESGIVETTFTKVNVNEQLNYFYSFFKPEATKKGIELIYKNDFSQKDIIIETDFDKFNSIVTNLLKNAVKYTKEGFIEFGFRAKEKKQFAELEIYVKDSGIGIPKNRQSAIFDRFIQADIEDKNAMQGSGLGLAISKAYAEMLGGNIWLESEVGKGSTFYFTIENRSGSEAKNTKINDNNLSVEDSVTEKLKILIVEDDEISQDLISIFVEKYAKEIIKVNSGVEAVDRCRNNTDIDLILMDVQMPGISGYEATKQIRKFNKEVIIIAQTAFALAGDREEALMMGCNDYISKPINVEELDSLINKYL